jgi:hypothetical protein
MGPAETLALTAAGYYVISATQPLGAVVNWFGRSAAVVVLRSRRRLLRRC